MRKTKHFLWRRCSHWYKSFHSLLNHCWLLLEFHQSVCSLFSKSLYSNKSMAKGDGCNAAEIYQSYLWTAKHKREKKEEVKWWKNSKPCANLLFIYAFWEQTVNTGELSLYLHIACIDSFKRTESVTQSITPKILVQCVNESAHLYKRTHKLLRICSGYLTKKIADTARPHQPTGSCVACELLFLFYGQDNDACKGEEHREG